ncbi:MAG TPA: oligosaccharide flippase family protein [Chloroflexota bacterium]
MREAPIASRIVSHLRVPLFRNAYALILSTGLTSGLGFVYWLVAARLYPPDVVGLNSAALSSMMFLAGLAQFSLTNVLIRFIPRAKTAALTLTDRATLLTVVAALVASLVFIFFGVDQWAPSLRFLRSSPLLEAVFALSTVTWGVFVLQEGILTGLRSATWVPVKNAAFSVGKLVLLVLFVALLPAYGIFVSWVVPAVLALVPMGLIVRRRLVSWGPAQAASDAPGLVPIQVFRYAVADYAGSLFWLAATMLVPVLVTEVAGATANAHFYLAWTIAYTLYLVAPSMGSSLIVESALDPAQLEAYSRRALLQTARLVVPLALALAVAAPWVLGLLGGGYAREGTDLLRLLALSAIPNVVNALYTSIARAQRHLVAIVAILAAQCVAVLGLSYLLLQSIGITGVGYAWLGSQAAIAVVLLAARDQIFRPAGAS